MGIQKKAIVTGGAKRIGKCIALTLAKEGYDIVLHYYQSHENAQETRKSIQDLGQKCVLCPGDLSAEESIHDWIKTNHVALSESSVLVNSASLFHEGPSPRMHALHYTAPQLISHAFAQAFPASQHDDHHEGHIINILDAMLRKPNAKYEDYFASKASLHSLTRTLALKLAPRIRVNAISPGCILYPEGSTAEQQEKILEQIPLKHPGQPEDIANACLALIRMTYVTGVNLVVDGGRSLA